MLVGHVALAVEHLLHNIGLAVDSRGLCRYQRNGRHGKGLAESRRGQGNHVCAELFLIKENTFLLALQVNTGLLQKAKIFDILIKFIRSYLQADGDKRGVA